MSRPPMWLSRFRVVNNLYVINKVLVDTLAGQVDRGRIPVLYTVDPHSPQRPSKAISWSRDALRIAL